MKTSLIFKWFPVSLAFLKWGSGFERTTALEILLEPVHFRVSNIFVSSI